MYNIAERRLKYCNLLKNSKMILMLVPCLDVSLHHYNHSPSWCQTSKIYFQYPINWKTSYRVFGLRYSKTSSHWPMLGKFPSNKDAMVDGNMTKLWKKGKYFYADSLGTSALKFKFRTWFQNWSFKIQYIWAHCCHQTQCINKLIAVWARSKCLGCEKLICLELRPPVS